MRFFFHYIGRNKSVQMNWFSCNLNFKYMKHTGFHHKQKRWKYPQVFLFPFCKNFNNSVWQDPSGYVYIDLDKITSLCWIITDLKNRSDLSEYQDFLLHFKYFRIWKVLNCCFQLTSYSLRIGRKNQPSYYFCFVGMFCLFALLIRIRTNLHPWTDCGAPVGRIFYVSWAHSRLLTD